MHASPPSTAPSPNERVNEAYADLRINDAIDAVAKPPARDGLRRLDHTLKESGIDPATRLHLVSSVIHLGRVGYETLPRRLDQARRRLGG